jgi:two-component system cell cycle sensor histidine kinase/response regulator CckA
MTDENNSGETVFSRTKPSEALLGATFATTCSREGPETILLVEDEPFVRNAAAEVLESAGYRLAIAGSAAEALETCQGRLAPLDLLLADVVMPGMSGRQLAVELASFYPSARVLLMSGYAEQLTAACELSSYYGHEYLAKPFSIRMLLNKVREVLDKPIDSARCSKLRLF